MTHVTNPPNKKRDLKSLCEIQSLMTITSKVMNESESKKLNTHDSRDGTTPIREECSEKILPTYVSVYELQIAVKWWLGLDTSRGSSCALCPDVALDPLGHHAATCRRGGDVVIRHNRLRDVFLSFCHQAHIAARLEAGSGRTPGLDRTRPADVLVRDWAQGKPAAFDINSHISSYSCYFG
ncbi:hypothetical protein EMCRGX_G033005 [Ephydatia muelleri]